MNQSCSAIQTDQFSSAIPTGINKKCFFSCGKSSPKTIQANGQAMPIVIKRIFKNSLVKENLSHRKLNQSQSFAAQQQLKWGQTVSRFLNTYSKMKKNKVRTVESEMTNQQSISIKGVGKTNDKNKLESINAINSELQGNCSRICHNQPSPLSKNKQKGEGFKASRKKNKNIQDAIYLRQYWLQNPQRDSPYNKYYTPKQSFNVRKRPWHHPQKSKLDRFRTQQACYRVSKLETKIQQRNIGWGKSSKFLFKSVDGSTFKTPIQVNKTISPKNEDDKIEGWIADSARNLF